MKVFFFANIQVVDCDNEWFRKELRRYLVLDAAGNAGGEFGWGMGRWLPGWAIPPG